MKFVIRKVREEKGISQRCLARAAGIARETLRGLESGEKSYISTAKLEKIAEVLEVPVYDIWH